MIEQDCRTCLYLYKNFYEEEPCITCINPIKELREFKWELNPIFNKEDYLEILTKKDCKKIVEESAIKRYEAEAIKAEEVERDLQERINKMVDTHYSEISKMFSRIESDSKLERYSSNFSDKEGVKGFFSLNRKLLRKYFESLGFDVIVYENNHGEDFVSMSISWEN